MTDGIATIEVKNLFAGYGSGDVIRDINFTVKAGENLCIMGPNGCGKSTLLKSMARLLPYRGTININDTDIATIPRREFAKKISLLGQMSRVLFPYTVYETISMGRFAHASGFLKDFSDGDRIVIDNIINKLDLSGIRTRMIDELSGGQLQRVFLARTLAQTPEVILLDEPTNHLDLKYQLELMAFLAAWVKESGNILITVFHDLNLARQFGQTALLLAEGTVIARGTVAETLRDDLLQEVYGVDIGGFMRKSLANWSVS
ncbi:MAG: ABC transporter ATP-binding protein [Treponema sp.]|nr:ABC transporter ATP-binding protein [Treponema sp.]